MLLDDLGAGERRKRKEKTADIAGYENSRTQIKHFNKLNPLLPLIPMKNITKQFSTTEHPNVILRSLNLSFLTSHIYK